LLLGSDSDDPIVERRRRGQAPGDFDADCGLKYAPHTRSPAITHISPRRRRVLRVLLSILCSPSAACG